MPRPGIVVPGASGSERKDCDLGSGGEVGFKKGEELMKLKRR